MEETKNINIDDLNGIGETKLKVIIITIQQPDPIQFCKQCEELFNSINQETFICFNTQNLQVQTAQGIGLIYLANLMYWGSEADHKAWETELKCKSLLIRA
jgi:hypothetical protein